MKMPTMKFRIVEHEAEELGDNLGDYEILECVEEYE